MPPSDRFEGAGIYAIYYTGDFPPYKRIAAVNRDGQFQAPIYVGKAVPPGARKGGFGPDVPVGPVLYKRLIEHARSIEQSGNLKLDDFACRYLVADDIWIPLGESLLIGWFQPVWNKVVDGFGIHDPGKGRQQQRRSMWDTLHPGRPWAETLAQSELNLQEIRDRVLESLPAPSILDELGL